MRTPRQALLALHLLYLATSTAAQNVATITANTQPTAMSGAPLTAQSSGSVVLVGATSTPTPSDHAPGGAKNPNINAGIVNYYFVFIALILCVVGVFIFFFLRRRRRMLARAHWVNSDQSQVERRRYGQGRWRSAEVSREEGLNEHGEAPPPYVPKTSAEEREGNGQGGQDGPTLPMQTLSRDGAGLKPPDYTETRIVKQHNGEIRQAVEQAAVLREQPTREAVLRWDC